MKGVGRLSTVLRYVDAAVEAEVADSQNRAPRVQPHIVARLGEMAFPGVAGGPVQSAADAIVEMAVVAAVRPEKRDEARESLREERVAEILGDELAGSLEDYAAARVAAALGRRGNAGTEAREYEGEPLRYLGVWRNDRDYQRGEAVTDGGCLWFARSTKPEGRPGREGSAGWQQMTR